jgi:hypothetical protein
MRQILFHHYFLFFLSFSQACSRDSWNVLRSLLIASQIWCRNSLFSFPYFMWLVSTPVVGGHHNSAKNSLFPDRLKWRQFQLSLEWGQVGRDVSCYVKPKVET